MNRLSIPLSDPRIPPAVRALAERGLGAVDSHESPWLDEDRVSVSIWYPWGAPSPTDPKLEHPEGLPSEHAGELERAGFRHTCINHPAAVLGLLEEQAWTWTTPSKKYPRAFFLRRDVDETGVSGTGRVAEGVQFTNGKVAMTWNSVHTSVAVYDNMRTLRAIHGHKGLTVVVWEDEEKVKP